MKNPLAQRGIHSGFHSSFRFFLLTACLLILASGLSPLPAKETAYTTTRYGNGTITRDSTGRTWTTAPYGNGTRTTGPTGTATTTPYGNGTITRTSGVVPPARPCTPTTSKPMTPVKPVKK